MIQGLKYSPTGVSLHMRELMLKPSDYVPLPCGIKETLKHICGNKIKLRCLRVHKNPDVGKSMPLRPSKECHVIRGRQSYCKSDLLSNDNTVIPAPSR